MLRDSRSGNAPALPERRGDVGVRFGVVRESHRRVVPLELHSEEADGDGPEQFELCQRAAVIGVRVAKKSGLAAR